MTTRRAMEKGTENIPFYR